MAAREWIFAALLFIAGCIVVAGFATFHDGLALVVGGVLLAGWSWLVFGDLDVKPDAP
jgi:hypothetical protein